MSDEDGYCLALETATSLALDAPMENPAAVLALSVSDPDYPGARFLPNCFDPAFSPETRAVMQAKLERDAGLIADGRLNKFAALVSGCALIWRAYYVGPRILEDEAALAWAATMASQATFWCYTQNFIVREVHRAENTAAFNEARDALMTAAHLKARELLGTMKAADILARLTDLEGQDWLWMPGEAERIVGQEVTAWVRRQSPPPEPDFFAAAANLIKTMAEERRPSREILYRLRQLNEKRPAQTRLSAQELQAFLVEKLAIAVQGQ